MQFKMFTFKNATGVTIQIQDCGVPEAFAKLQHITPHYNEFRWVEGGMEVEDFLRQARAMFAPAE